MGGLYGIELIYIYISNLADTFIQSDLQMRTILCVCVCVLFFCKYSHRFSISCDIGYKSACFLYFIQEHFYFYFFYLYTGTFSH